MRKAIAFCAGFLVLPALVSLAAEIARPVLLMGDKYGRYERQRWVQKLLLPEQIAFTHSDEWVPPARATICSPCSPRLREGPRNRNPS